MPSLAANPDRHPGSIEFDAAAPEPVFDVQSAIELDRRALAGRVGFAGLYALISLLVLPWPMPAAWIGALIAWEIATNSLFNPFIGALTERRAKVAFATFNLVGSLLYGLVALAALATGSPIGIAIGATWLGGSYMNSFVYYGQNRSVLWASLAPVIAIAIAGPMLGHGPTLSGAVISSLILTAMAGAHSFSLDHQVMLRRLGERQSALAEVERKLSLAVEASGDGLFEVDLVGGERQVSAGWASMLGYEPGELENPQIMRFVHPDDLEMVQAELAAHLGGQTPHTSCELRLRCKDGRYKWVLWRGRLVWRTPDGRPSRLIGTTVDISARKALEFQLEHARDVAERANDAKSMFVANMSHEIRTPLNGVIGVAAVLARTPLMHEQREMVALVQSSAQILERLLSDILDQSKLEAGEFALQVAPFDLRRAVEAAAELMRPRAEEKALAFEMTYDGAADGVFLGDGVRLRQVISNLAANAIKFTESGEVRIAVSAQEPAAASEPTLVTITVTDTGIGFDEHTAERLFGRFVQADGSISRRFGGTGLGLAISKTLTELMGGEIAAASTPGAGSRFTVTVPLARDIPLAEYRARKCGEAEEAADEEEEGVAIAGLRVLVAEDHPTNQRVIALILGPLGVDLTFAGDGQEAVDAFRPGGFDLVLMDMQMPRMDGLTAMRHIRRRERDAGAPATPMAMLTANAMAEHRQMGAAAGADWHIAKPVTPESLLAGIAETLASARPTLAVAS